jgi:hypothetical protein
MRPLTRACALLVALSFALAGCGKDKGTDNKDKKDDKQGGTDGKGAGGGQPSLPPSKVDPGHPAQTAAAKVVTDIQKSSDAFDLTRVSGRFLIQIGKPRKPGTPFDDFYAREWLREAGTSLATASQVSSPFSGFGQPGAAVFTGTFMNRKGEKGRYLIRMVEEGGAWKLDWFQTSAVQSNEAPPPASIDDPFKDVAVQAAADLVAVPPSATGTPPEILPGAHRAALAATLFSTKLRGAPELGANLEKEDDQGYDYKRTWLGDKLDAFVGGKVASYTRTKVTDDTYKVEFTLEGGAKKAFEVKLVGGGSPGLWKVDEFRALPSA